MADPRLYSRCVINGQVRGKPRPRFSVVAGRARAYTPRAQSDYEAAIAAEYVSQGGRFHEGEVGVRITVRRALPKSAPRSLVRQPDTLKPDADNVCKSVLDALNGVAWADDAQVTHLSVEKMPRERRDVDEMVIEVASIGDLR